MAHGAERKKYMKKLAGTLFIFLLAIVLVACGNSEDAGTAALLAELEALREEIGELMTESSEDVQEDEDIEEDVDDVIVTVIDANRVAVGDGRLEFLILISNNTDVDISGIQGHLHFYEGNRFIMRIEADFTGETIPSRGTLLMDSVYWNSSLTMPHHVSAMTAFFNRNLQFEYAFSRVIFADGTIVNF